ncbi:15395_t:CDS:2 [Funneliformis caledonium]|uniref:15395_t:CDS:1 n=1 Tax=Funneliformis caledonium TaxID=1117310 RepID=A0A9N9F6K1_9GLOM|nr:15395_t:CDS:2 [Funneliformis caledonium]
MSDNINKELLSDTTTLEGLEGKENLYIGLYINFNNKFYLRNIQQLKSQIGVSYFY